jgi:hypothetical protein
VPDGVYPKKKSPIFTQDGWEFLTSKKLKTLHLLVKGRFLAFSAVLKGVKNSICRQQRVENNKRRLLVHPALTPMRDLRYEWAEHQVCRRCPPDSGTGGGHQAQGSSLKTVRLMVDTY